MAKSDLKLTIGTECKDDGIKKLDNALKNTAKSVNSAKGAIGGISSELEKMSGTVGKVTGGISGLFSAFAQGGIIGISVAAITTSISLIVKYFEDAKEKAKELGKTISDSIGREVDLIANRISQIFVRRDKVNNNIQSAIDYRSGMRNADDAGILANYQAGMLDRIQNAKNPYERQRLEAELQRGITLTSADQKLQGLKDRQAKLQGLQNSDIRTLGDAQRAVREGQPLLNEMNQNAILRQYRNALGVRDMIAEDQRKYGGNADRLSAANDEIKKLDEQGAKDLFANYEKAAKSVDENKKLIDKLNEDIRKRQDEISLNNRNIQVAEIEANNVRKKANIAYQRQIEAINKSEQAEKDRLQKEQDAKARAEKIKTLEEEKQRLLREQNKASDDLKNAEKNLAEKLEQRAKNSLMSFSDWRKQQQEESEIGNITERNRQRAERQLERLTSRGNMRSKFDNKRIRELQDYLGDDAVRVAQNEVEKAKQREEQREKNEEKRTKSLEQIESALKEIKDKVGI